MTEYLKIKNWEKFQHYKKRRPPWVKLYHELLDDYEYGCLQDDSKLLLISLFLLAGTTDNKIPNDPKWIQNKAMLSTEVVIQPLVDTGFISINSVDDIKLISSCKQSACLETETETELETYKKEAEIDGKSSSLFKFRDKVKIPGNIFLTDTMRGYAKKQNCQENAHVEYLFEKFKNYYRQKGLKNKDWNLTFYDWVLKDKKDINTDKYKAFVEVGK